MRNIQRWMVLGLLVLTTVSFSIAQPQGGAPNFIGNWKFNPAKSKMNLTLPPRTLTRKYEDRGGGVYVFTQEGTAADGSRMFSMYVAKEDGTSYPLVIEGNNNLSNITIKKIDNFTSEQLENVNAQGRGGMKGTRVVSPDGRTLTITIRPNAPAGGGDESNRTITPDEMNMMVFDKQ